MARVNSVRSGSVDRDSNEAEITPVRAARRARSGAPSNLTLSATSAPVQLAPMTRTIAGDPSHLRIVGNLCHSFLQHFLRNAAPLECISQFARCVLIELHLIPA